MSPLHDDIPTNRIKVSPSNNLTGFPQQCDNNKTSIAPVHRFNVKYFNSSGKKSKTVELVDSISAKSSRKNKSLRAVVQDLTIVDFDTTTAKSNKFAF